MHTNCAAHRMHSCCNPLLHDMLHLTASAVSCIEPVVSRLQAASAEVAVAKLLLVCLCCMTLCWVFSLPTTIPRYCVGGGSTCIELYSTNRSRTQHSHLELLSCCHNPNDVWQGCTVSVLVHVGLRSRHNSDIVVGRKPTCSRRDYEENPHTTQLFVYCMCAAVRMMNDMLHLPASAGSCAEPVGTGSISRQLAEVAVAISACMHVCRIPPYVVC